MSGYPSLPTAPCVGRTAARDHMPEQHRALFGQLPIVDQGVQDAQGPPWATVLTGPAGFLATPDTPGHMMFNTLGNLLQWPQAGLLFVDHDSGDLLQLAAHTTLRFDGEVLHAFPGAQRLLRARVIGGWWRANALPLVWRPPQLAPQLTARSFPGFTKPGCLCHNSG